MRMDQRSICFFKCNKFGCAALECHKQWSKFVETAKTKEVEPDYDGEEELDEEDPINENFGDCENEEVVDDGAETLVIRKEAIVTKYSLSGPT